MGGHDRSESDVVDADEIYRQIGHYVVAFQSLHDLLFQICWLLGEPSYGESTRRKLARIGFYDLVSETGRRVHAFLVDLGRENAEFARRFHASLAECRKLGKDRNRVVHSAYVHLESYGRLLGIARADMKKDAAGTGVEIDSEMLAPASFDSRIEEIAATYVPLSFARTQLIHWHA